MHAPSSPTSEATSVGNDRADDDGTLRQSEQASLQTAALSRHPGQPPGRVAGFAMIRPLGAGAYGAVWLAQERKTGRLAAVKFFSRRGQDWALLGREVEKLAALDVSRHIVGLIEVGWDADPPFYVMEYLPNGSLAELLKSRRLSVAESVEIAADVLRGLIHAHGSGILHCDLKPANVLLDPDFRPRLCDFGQARLSDEERPALGTLFYMAPEQANLAASPDARWDVYAAGALLYHMLTGHPPHRTPEVEEELRACGNVEERLQVYRRRIRRAGAPRDHDRVPGVDHVLGDIVQRCLAPDPAKRYRNAQSVLGALTARQRRRGRRPLVILGLVGPLLLLLAMLPFFLTTMRDAEQTAKRTLIERSLESDALAARLLARNLAQELHRRTVELEAIVNSKALTRAVEHAIATDWQDRSEIEEVLSQEKAASDRRRARFGLTKDTSWFLNDVEGRQRWRDPFQASTNNIDFSYKDYFHGRGVQYDAEPGGSNPEPEHLPILEVSHVSTVFRSDATGHYMVAITAPITNDQGEVIAQLGRTQHLWELLADYELDHHEHISPGSHDHEGHIRQQLVLIDDRNRNGQLVGHPWMTEKHVKQLDAQSLAQLRLSEEVIDRFQPALRQIEAGERKAAIKLNFYHDPVGQEGFAPRAYGGLWLAAAYPVPGTEWVALVQEPRGKAVAPAEQLRADLLIYAGVTLLVGGGLIVTFWYFVTQALAERAVREHRRPDGSSSGEIDTGGTVF